MIRLYDTMAREKRDFVPADPKRITMYVCGPTVYGPQAERPEWMTASRTYPLLNASGRGIVDWVEARRLRPRPIGAEE